MPSVVEFCQLNDDCGLANASISAAMASDRNIIPKWRNLGSLLFTGIEKPVIADTLKLPYNFCSRQIYQPIIPGMIIKSQKKPGYANSIPLNMATASFRYQFFRLFGC